MNGEMKILVILASGIGNSILFGPALRDIRKHLPDSRIDVFAYRQAFGEPFRESDFVDSTIAFVGLSTIWRLRRARYDISITAFPSNRWQFNVLAFLVGARKRITHSYKVGRLRTVSFLQNVRIPVDETIHDVDQNLNLLQGMGITPSGDKSVLFHVSEEHEKYSEEFLQKNGLIGRHLIGVHPGAGPLAYKKAPLEKFLEMIAVNVTDNSSVLIFGGPEEQEIKENLKCLLDRPSCLVEANLKNTAALIRRCDLFISNDTGLMHIATTSRKTRVIALFKKTNPTRTRPYTENAEVVVLEENEMKYPFWSTRTLKL